jgi:hypothetical protein
VEFFASGGKIREWKADLKAVFYCSRFARAGGENMFQLLLSLSNLGLPLKADFWLRFSPIDIDVNEWRIDNG